MNTALRRSTTPAQASTGQPPPNIVFILADDLGWADTGCYGADLHETPNIDRLAREGLRFTDAYAAAPVCSPTRASILTGRHPARLNMTIWSEAAEHPPRNRRLIPPITRSGLPLEQVTYADVLRQRYFMAHVGKWHLGDASHYPEAQGFDLNIGGTHWGCPVTYFYPYKGAFNSEEFRYIPDLESGNESENAYLTDRLTDEALRLMGTVRDRPFFINLCYYTVHTPIQGKPDWVDHYRKRSRPDLHHRNVGYAAMVASLDENVGRILQRLDELGIDDNTVVFFFSDNGGYVGRYAGETVTDNFPLRSGKGALYEGGIREPLIVRWPGRIPAGAVCCTPVVSTDFFPTFLDLAGLGRDPRREEAADGLSLSPLLRTPQTKLDRDALYWHYPHYYETTAPVSAVRRDAWKLLEYFEDGHIELYHVSEDISEQHDMADSEPQIAAELRQMLQDWRRAVGARLPSPNPDFTPDRKK
ncbi:MAG: sulfatase [Kiritimatiellaeota bacterium]|nr:sulfatase [Kiritimatiellota bacterium]